MIAETTLAGCKDYYDHRSAGGTMSSLVVTAKSERARETRPAYGIRTMIDTDFSAGREIIPGHFAEANICLLVGPEGFGKSLFMRQMAMQCAAGINPFTSADMEPLKVLYVDGENPEHQQKLDWVRLDYLARRHRNGIEVPDENLTIIAAWEDAPNLVSPNGEAWFNERVTAFRPDICFLGPVSDLVDGKLSDDDVVRKFKRALYRARAICGTAFVVEHHSPHRMQGDKTREMRPYGSSVFRRFPDFGYGLQPKQEPGEFELAPFRGARVRSRAWPTDLRWGSPNSNEWPWEFVPDVRGSVTVGNFGGGA
jgi:replicative DNA helicase